MSTERHNWTLTVSAGSRLAALADPSPWTMTSVPVLEATLTDERVESFAKFMAVNDDSRNAFLWKRDTKAMRAVKKRYRERASLYLQVEGFRTSRT